MRALTVSATFAVAMLLSGCGTTGPRAETSQWSAREIVFRSQGRGFGKATSRSAGKLYERLEGRASGTALAQQAQIEKAYVLLPEDGRQGAGASPRSSASSSCTRRVNGVDYALYLQGLINFNDNLGLLGSLTSQDLSERDQQASRDAYQSFRRLVEQYPQSPYADDARLRMNYIVNSLASYEVHVARYYYRRGAYVAAINRAQQTVQEFQQSPSTEEALFIMIQGYDQLGLTQLRDDAARVLKQSYPNSTIYTAGLGTKKSRWWQLW